jgi:hypothetical protein
VIHLLPIALPGGLSCTCNLWYNTNTLCRIQGISGCSVVYSPVTVRTSGRYGLRALGTRVA